MKTYVAASTTVNSEKWRKRLQKVLRNYELYLFLLPAFVVIVLFEYAPMYGVQIAFKDFYGLEIKYPRARRNRDGKPYGYEWFQQNKKKPLPTAQEVNSNDRNKVLDGWS